MPPRFLLPLALSALVLALGFPSEANGPAPAASSAEPASRTFEFTYQVHFPAEAEAGNSVRLWIPLPQNDGYQNVLSLHVDSPVKYAQLNDPEYKNRIAVFKPNREQAAKGFDVTVRFVAVRKEHKVALDQVAAKSSPAPAADPLMHRYLEPDKLVPLNGTIAELAKEHTSPDMTTLQKARSLYEFVVSTMRYDKSGQGWGHGDAIWACTSKRGNCTDFHSLFIGMARASGIPARFEMGFSIPEGKSEGEIAGYHCWAEFYVSGIGWIPVDASEAWKNPAKHDYFFGAHDVNRVFFTYGRDLRLSSDQKGDPLNYFIYPYAEDNGQPVKDLQSHFSFRDVTAGSQAAAL
ncbi:MAG TPA: transglutaminase domain-containing protein [Candidatus Bathyarchaeia archaeon]|nr:transglutaminase domain-containing protein [Candidatus Bathyarchaeia archaeon]